LVEPDYRTENAAVRVLSDL